MELRQPQALWPLFLTEMWERFGFYVIQSLLIFYLTNFLNFADAKAYLVLGEFTALIYIAPLLGGFFSDRVLGPRFAIIVGAIFLGLGYMLLGLVGKDVLYVCLACIVLGNGLLKPNISSFLGEFYYADDPRRDAGFTLFYIGINIGGLLALTSAGFIQEKFGWSSAFLSAAFGMILALLTFCFTFKTFENRGMPIPRQQIKPKQLQLFARKWNLIWLLIISFVVIYLLIRSARIAEYIQNVVGLIILVIMLYLAYRSDPRTRKKLYALIILIVSSIIFWGLFFQAFGSINLFTERNVDRHLFGIIIPTPMFISLESIFIIILGPFLASLWKNLHMIKRDPTPGMKFSLALFFTGIGMFFLLAGIHFHRPDDLINPIWILLFYLMLTLGEMLLSPIGLAMVTELSPPHLTGMMMGVWFMALGYGGELSGFLASKASIPKSLTDLATTNEIYFHTFWGNAVLAIVVGIALLILSPWLKRLIRS